MGILSPCKHYSMNDVKLSYRWKYIVGQSFFGNLVSDLVSIGSYDVLSGIECPSIVMSFVEDLGCANPLINITDRISHHYTVKKLSTEGDKIGDKT
jgi:hypothetical protein